MSLQDVNNAIDECRMTPADKDRLKRLVALISKSSRDMNAFELRAAREAAGLTVRQAAGLLQLSPVQLCELEDGEWTPCDGPSVMSDRFDEVYGLCPEA